ncbi:MAG TPA: sugar ABC transporter ATP-binding protein [Kofleriaceae bacterium]|nr:sugar ABC transporter ATP-binding protein [Kofleriaceae bacterium]
MTRVLLELRDIVKTFGSVKALDRASLTLRAGEIHALMGENGAGKSTLIKVLTGVHAPDAGTIVLDGKPIAPRSPREAEQAGISTVYQEVNLIPTLSIADNLLLGRQPTRLGWIRRRELVRRAEAAVARLGLEIDVTRAVGACPLAIQQMVAIARALDIRARVLVLDEPTSSLDEREVASLFDLLRRLRGEGLAIVLVTHFLDQVYAVSDRITVLRNGAFVGEHETSELPRRRLIEAMLGRDFGDEADARPAAAAAATGKRLLEARGIGRRGLLSPIDLALSEGEIVGLAGLLGAGRTETARLLFGLEAADSGAITIGGQAAVLRSPRDAMGKGLAFCSEDRRAEGILPHLSVRENLILAMQAGRGPWRLLPRREQDALVDHYIRALGIKAPSPEAPIHTLSGGNQQKVLLARALATQPKILLLDEPTRGIDVGAKLEIERLVRSLRERGMSVLFISSDLDELVRTCGRVAVLRDRRKVGELAGDDVRPDKILSVIAHEHDAA